jgi:lysozyme family protein
MKRNFDRSLRAVLELEGKLSTDQHDPGNAGGGFTVWGLSSRYNPEVTRDMSIEKAAIIYKTKYWDKAGCDDLPFPFDLVCFDTCVNQGPGTLKTLINGDLREFMNQYSFHDLLLMRMLHYKKHSKDIYVKGHLFRVLRLYQMILDW